MLTFWVVEQRAYDRPSVEWKWWDYKLPEEDQGVAMFVLAQTEPDDLVLAHQPVAERIAGLRGRPRLVSVRESYLTNLSRHWGKGEFSDRMAMMKLTNKRVAEWQYDHALRLVDERCVKVVVIRKLHMLEDLGVARRMETGKGTMIYMSPESWEHVRPHVTRLMELETELAAEDDGSGAAPPTLPGNGRGLGTA